MSKIEFLEMQKIKVCTFLPDNLYFRPIIIYFRTGIRESKTKKPQLCSNPYLFTMILTPKSVLARLYF